MEFTSQDVANLLRERAPQAGVDPEVAFAMFVAENSKAGEWNPLRKVRLDTMSPAGARGIMQVMPATLEGLKRQGYLTPDNRMQTLQEQVDAGLAAIKAAQDLSGSRDPRDLAVLYNSTPGYFQKYVQSGRNPSVLLPETQGYLQKLNTTLGPKMQEMTGGNSPVAAGLGGITPASASGLPAAMQSFDTISGQLTELMRAITGEQQGLAKTAVDAAKTVGTAQGAAVTAKAAEQNAVDAHLRQILQANGANMLDPNSRVFQAQQDLAVATQQVRNLEPVLTQLQAKSPLEDPLGWFMDQLKLNQVGKQWQMAKANEQRAAQTIQTIQVSTSQQQQINPAIVQDIRNRGALAQAQAAEADATYKAAQVQMHANSERFGMARAELAVAGDKVSQQFQWQRMLREDQQLQAHMVKLNKEQHALDRFNNVVTAFGAAPALTEQDRKGYGAQQEEFAARMATQMPGMLGADVPDMVRGAILFPGALTKWKKDAPGTEVFVRNMITAAEQRLGNVKPGAPDYERVAKMSRADQLAWASEKIWKEWEADASNNDTLGMKPENPWRLQTKVAANADTLKNNSIAQYVLAMGNQAPDEKGVVGYALAQIAKGAPQDVVVDQLHQFFTEGMKHQLNFTGVTKTGVSMADPKSGRKTGEMMYRVSVNKMLEETGWGSPELGELNLFNKGEMQNLLTKMQQRQRQFSPQQAGLASTQNTPGGGKTPGPTIGNTQQDLAFYLMNQPRGNGQ